ncbi:MAG: PAS domain-containing protein [Desulfovibrionales bacterium]|nr:PAS domain-containing protein [Desulfovibrionales bacterium]
MRPIFSRLKFETKLNLGILTIVAFMALTLLPIVARMTSSALINENKMRGLALTESLAARAVDPILTQDYLRLRNLVGEPGDAVYAFILNDDGRVMGHSFLRGFPVDLIQANIVGSNEPSAIQLLDTGQELIYDFATPVLIGGEKIGTVRLGLSKSRITSTTRQLVSAIVTVFAGTLLAAMAMGNIFSRTVTRRLALLRSHAEELVTGSLDSLAVLPGEHFCWEIMHCQDDSCPAFQDKVRRCWHVPNTKCSGHACRIGPKPASCRGCPVFLEGTGDEIQDVAQTFDFMAYTLRDHIRGLREVQHSLTLQKRLLSTVLDMNPDLISLVDTRMVYQTANRAFAQNVGRTVDEIQGLNDFHLFSEEEAERRNLEGREVLLTGARVDRQERVDTGPDFSKWFHVVQIPVQDESGHIVGLLRMDRDITDIKAYEQQLIQAQKMESIGKLAGGVAHEINTPLGIILGYAQLLKDDVPQESQMWQDLGIIEKQTQVCRKIVADLLGFSRQVESDKREMCFNNSVMEAISLVRHSFELDHVEIISRLDDRYPIIYGDPEKLKQVWLNLLNNAKDALPASGGIIVVTTCLNTPQGIITLQVADSGSGIDIASQKKIFDPFFTTKAVGKGTGLGLSVSFGIVKDHKGEIRVESPIPDDFEMPERIPQEERGPGTIFIVDIPLDHYSMP